MRFLDDQRRKHANDIVAGRDRQQALGPQIGDEGAAVGLHLDAEHQAEPAHAFEQMVVVGDHLLERRAQPLALGADIGEEFVIGDDVEHRLPGGHRQRIAAIGRAVGADDHPARRFLGREAGAQREAAADALGAWP